MELTIMTPVDPQKILLALAKVTADRDGKGVKHDTDKCGERQSVLGVR